MEPKLFGVNISLIRELRRFQSSLRKRSEKIPFMGDVKIRVNDGSPFTAPVLAHEGIISISDGLINTGPLPRQRPILSEELDEMIMPLRPVYVARIQSRSAILNISFIFNSSQGRAAFLGALGDLENIPTSSSSSSSESEEEVAPGPNNGILN